MNSREYFRVHLNQILTLFGRNGGSGTFVCVQSYTGNDAVNPLVSSSNLTPGISDLQNLNFDWNAGVKLGSVLLPDTPTRTSPEPEIVPNLGRTHC